MEKNQDVKRTKKRASLIRGKIYNRIYGQIRNPHSRYGYLLHNINHKELIGIDYYEYAIYLERKNKDNLKFEKNKFDLDHILPLARSLTPQEYLSRWNYKNTCMEDVYLNRNKASSYNHEYTIRKIIRDKYLEYRRKEKKIKVFDEFYSYEQLKYILMYSGSYTFEKFLINIYSMEHIGDVDKKYINFSFNNVDFNKMPCEYLRFSDEIIFNLRKFLFIINPIEYFNHRQDLIELADKPKKIFQKLAAEYEFVKSEKIDQDSLKVLEKFLKKIIKKKDIIECQKIIKTYHKNPIKEKKFLKFLKKLQSKTTYKVGELKAFNELTSDKKSIIVLTDISDGLYFKKMLIDELKNGYKNGIISEKKYAQTLIDVLESYEPLTAKRDLIMTLCDIWKEGLITEKLFIKAVRKLASEKCTKGENALLKQIEKNAKKFEKQSNLIKIKMRSETKINTYHNSLALCFKLLGEDYQNRIFNKKEYKKEYLKLISKFNQG